MIETTTKLWDFHRQKERARIVKAEVTANEKKHKAKQKNEEMQVGIAKEEHNYQEGAQRGKLTKRVIDQMKKYAKAEAKVLMDKHRKKDQVKCLSERKHQRSKPIRFGGRDTMMD